MDGSELMKVRVTAPPGTEDAVMDAVTSVVRPVYPRYDRAFTLSRVTGTWRPLEGSSPYKGRVGEVEVAEEVLIEFAVRGEDLRAAVAAIRSVHPYEEPAIDVIPMIGWKGLIA